VELFRYIYYRTLFIKVEGHLLCYVCLCLCWRERIIWCGNTTWCDVTVLTFIFEWVPTSDRLEWRAAVAVVVSDKNYGVADELI
jgi:hypothetical protein